MAPHFEYAYVQEDQTEKNRICEQITFFWFSKIGYLNIKVKNAKNRQI